MAELLTVTIRLPSKGAVKRAPRVAPPSLRPTRLDPLQVDVLAALIDTLPDREG